MSVGTTISLRIDGELVKAMPGQTLFEVAQRCGKYIPGLCQFKGLAPVGACRLCVVELASVNRVIPSCTTLAQEGMSVVTASPKLTSCRRMALELLFAEGNHVCAICVSSGHCELQALAVTLGVTHVRYNYTYPRRSTDMSHPRFVLDHNRCILCTRCIRVCSEVEGAHVWDVSGRGSSSRITAEMNRLWGDAKSCTGCGKCVDVCPTGALAKKGYAVTEMIKDPDAVTRLVAQRRAGG
ncbi:MAG: bidirectional hydrogenase complex protein HoxU [Polyangiaceae bacterium]